MEAVDILVFLAKSNLAILLFYALYRIVFAKDVFFRLKRFVLLAFYLVAGIYPFVDLSLLLPVGDPGLYALGQDVFGGRVLREIIVSPLQDGSPSGMLFPYRLLLYVYFAGVVAVVGSLFIQTGLILRMLIKSKKEQIGGTKVRIAAGISTPFSYWGWIFLPEKDWDSRELDEIMIHERTHVAQVHSFDTLLSCLMCALYWFNPAVWFLRREVRINLEFLADGNVLNSGCNAEHYQLHLLRLSHNKAAAQITNNFNVSPLKKRIMMMNKEQRSKTGLWKYALILPLAGALFFANCSQGEKSGSESGKEPPVKEAMAPEETLTVGGEKVYEVAEQMPGFPGGEKALIEYLSKNINYPEDAKAAGTQGRVVARFVVNKDGSISNAKILRSLSESCDKEALRVINAMPKWQPGKQGGKEVAVFFALPIRFLLD